MSDTFMGLHISVRGLYSSQKALSVVNHNINNVNTPGFSRQVAEQTASRPMLSPDGVGMMGTGSEVNTIGRIHDDYLDYKYWSEAQALGEWEKKKILFSEIEATFNEPSDSGFNTIMNEFYGSLHELAKNPESSAIKALVKEKGMSVAKYFNNTSIHFEKLQEDINNQIKMKVDEVNSYAMEIAKINRQIYTQEISGHKANDLRDQRAVLVDKISKIINIEAYEVTTGKMPNGEDEKKFIVTISGKALIDHYDYSELEVRQRETKLNEEDVDKLYEVRWADGNKLKIKAGELKACIDIRDGNEGDNGSPLVRGIPYYQKMMNTFARGFAKSFNEGIIDKDGDGDRDKILGHADGYRINSSENSDPAGIRFFTMKNDVGEKVDSLTFINGADTVVDDPLTPNNEFYDAIDAEYEKITAKNLSISFDIDNDYANNICTSSRPAEKGNNEIIGSLIEMRHNTYMFVEGAAEDFVKSMVSTIAIDSQQAGVFESNQKAITQQIVNRRLSVSGVSLNEEMANMVKFQHAYQASAKMISTLSEVLDIMINGIGL